MPCSSEGLVSEPQAGAATLQQPGAAEALEAEKNQETRPETRDEREQLRSPTGPIQERRLDL